MDILYLVDRLENLIASSSRLPLVNQIVIKEADILSVVDQMRTSIPEEIKQARRIIQEKERIIAQAQAEATTLLTRARDESERAINREELVRNAAERSQSLVHQAEARSEQMKNEADLYVAETLRALRDHLLSIETDVSRSILSIEKGLESIEGAPEEGEEQYDEPLSAQQAAQSAQPTEPTQPRNPGHMAPRRASLAADTRGGPMYADEY